MSDMMDPTDIFDADEIDNAIKIIENEIEAVKKNEVAEVKPAETQVQKEEYSVDSLITKALNYVENVNSQADDVYHLFYSPLATGRDRTDASKVAIVESLRLKNENINAITNLVNAKAKLEAEEKNRKATEAQVDQLLTWAERYDEATYEAKHLIIAALVDQVEVNKNYDIKIHFKISAEQFLGKVIRIA